LDSITVPKKKQKQNKNNSNNNNTDKKAPTVVVTPKTINSNANNLIFKQSKEIYGEVPHFKGTAQNAALELCPMVAIEVYACVTCLYSRSSCSGGSSSSSGGRTYDDTKC
jgi:hypothetical protein